MAKKQDQPQFSENNQQNPQMMNDNSSSQPISHPDSEPPPQPAEPQAKTPVLVSINTLGQYEFADQTQLASAAHLAIKQKLAPEDLRAAGVEAVMSALLTCKQFGLKAKAMNKMAYIKGKLTIWGSLYTAIAETHPEYGEREDIFMDGNCERICAANKNLKSEVWAVACRTRKKNSTTWNEYFFTMDDAKRAGILKNVWLTYPKDQLFHKANKRMIDANYASAVEGLEYYEDVKEIYDVTPTVETTPVTDLNKELS